MCLPTKSDPSARSMLGLGVLMLVACLAGPALIGGALVALALCAALPAIVVAVRRISAARGARPTAPPR